MSLNRWSVNFQGNERVDLPDFRNMMNQAFADFDNLVKTYIDNDAASRVLQRYQQATHTPNTFKIAKDLTRAIQDQNQKWSSIIPDAANSTIDITVPTNTTFYIEVALVTSNDDLQTRAFWDTDVGLTGQEFFDDINVRKRIDETFQAVTGGFSGGIWIPLFTGQTDPGGVISNVTRSDDLLWKARAFSLPANNVRPTVYESSLKNLRTQIDFYGALWNELKGTGQSIETVPYSSIKLLREYQNLFFTGGGSISFEGLLPADTVGWDADFGIEIAGRALPYVVSAANYVLLDGECLYVSIPEGAPVGPLTVVTADFDSLQINPSSATALPNNVMVLFLRRGAKIYGAMDIPELESGEVVVIGNDMDEGLQARLGITGPATFQAYTSSFTISLGDNYPSAISKLDEATEQFVQDRNVWLIGGGVWSFDATSGSLAWDAQANLSVPGLDDSENVIPSGFILLADGDVVETTYNRVGPGGSLTLTNTPIASFVPEIGKIILARRLGTVVYVGVKDGFMLLNDLESKQLGAGMSIQNRDYIGIPSESDSAPDYTTAAGGSNPNVFIADADPIIKAIKLLDDRADLQRLIVNQNHQSKLYGSGLVDWDLGTETLSWASILTIAIPGLADTVNQIPAGSEVLQDGEIIWALINRSGAGGFLSLTVSDAATTTLGDDAIVIARRIGSFVLVGLNDGIMLLRDGESKVIGNGLSAENLTFLGIANEATSSPAWNTGLSAPLRTIPLDTSPVTTAVAQMDIQIDKFFGQLRLKEHPSNVSRVIVTGVDITMLDSSILSTQMGTLLMSFDGAEIDFDTGEVFESDGITSLGIDFTPFTIPVGEFFWYGVALTPNGTNADNTQIVQLLISEGASANASAALAPKPTFSGSPVAGAVLVQNLAGTVTVNTLRQFFGGSGSGGSDTFSAIAGENITVSSNPIAVYVSPGNAAGDTGRTAGRFYRLDTANVSVPIAAIRSQGVGFITRSATAGAANDIQYRGPLSGFTGLTQGAVMYGDPALLGGNTQIIPITIGYWVTPIGQAISDTKILVNPSAAEDSYVVAAANLQAWPSIFVSSEAQFSAALASLTGVGGVICLLTSFSITSSYTIPSNVILVGRGFGTTLTLAGSGNTLTLSTGSEIRDLKLTPTYSSGTMVSLPNNFCVLDKCWFLVSPSSTVVCVDITGNSNRLFVNRFDGVAGGPAIGVQYTSGSDNSDNWSIFL